MGFRFVLRPESFCIHRLPPDRPFDLTRLSGASWYSVTRTSDELSIVAPAGYEPGPGDREAGWSCLQIAGILAFEVVGVIAGIAKVLAEAKVAIFTVSTYNTDYFLVKTSDLDRTIAALTAAGHTVTTQPPTVGSRSVESDHATGVPRGGTGRPR